MNPEFARRRKNRTDFLVHLYEMVDGSVSAFESAYEICAALGIDASEVNRIIEYLEEKQWLHIDDHKLGVVRITAEGIDQVETME